MSDKLTAAMSALQQLGAADYRAHEHDYASANNAQVHRRVARKRAVYGAGVGIGSVAAVGAIVFAASAVGGREALTIGPAGTSTSPTSQADDAASSGASPSPVPSQQADDQQDPGTSSAQSISPGTGAEAILALGAKSLNVSVDELRAAVIAALPAQAEGNYEGWLSVDDMLDLSDATPDMLAEFLVGSTIKNLKASGVAPADYQETLIKASLITQEARNQSDYAELAAVIDNRLDQGMNLELDSTVKYVSPSQGEFTSDDERATDSPYNTYMYDGLPPGPIGSAIPAAAIDAAAHPAQSDSLFFVTVNMETGETKFSDNFSEHQQNVWDLQDWVREHPEYVWKDGQFTTDEERNN